MLLNICINYDFVACGLTIISVEAITKKAIEAYQSEWKKLQTEYSSPNSDQDDVGEVLTEDTEGMEGRTTTHIIVNHRNSIEALVEHEELIYQVNYLPCVVCFII